MRRRAISTQEVTRLRETLAADYPLRDYEIDVGPKILRLTGPDLSRSLRSSAAARTRHARQASEELLHGRDALAPTPELSASGDAPWTDLWPSAHALASYFGHAVRMRSLDAVEIHCGLGTAGLGAAAKGARVILTDPDPEALRFARFNALRNGFTHVRTQEFDWRTEQLSGEVGSLILADALTSEANFDLVFRLLNDNLSPGRTAFLAEPGRPIATGFFDVLRRTDYRIRLDIERVPDVSSDSYYLIQILRIKKDA